MKVAIVLSGLARKVQEGYDNYWSRMIEKYNPDLYLHCWKDEEWELVSQVYQNPKKLIVEDPFSFRKYYEGVNADDTNTRPTQPYDVAGNFRGLPMFWSWQKMANEIEGEYDLIIRSRYDLGWHITPDLGLIDKSKLNICQKHWGGREIPDDNLMVSNQENFHKFFNTCFDDLITYLKDKKHLHFQEKNLLLQLKEKEMDVLLTKTPILDFNLLRDNKIWY
jgi:hypothetical protein